MAPGPPDEYGYTLIQGTGLPAQGSWQPASVVTARLESTRRIMRLPVSLTKAYTAPPTAPTATAVGELKTAAVPMPSDQPAEPEPATVDVLKLPVVSTTRSAWLSRSATRTKEVKPPPSAAYCATPDEKKAMPIGELNLAFAPLASSTKPGEADAAPAGQWHQPASVEDWPAPPFALHAIRRTQLAADSVT